MIQSTGYANAVFLCLVLFNQKSAAVRTIIEPTTVQPPETGICPTQEETKEAIRNIQTVIKKFKTVSECGAGMWFQVAHLNMSDTSQNCPPAWTEYNSTNNVRTCDRPETSGGSCASVFFPTNQTQYSNICGRVIGYQRTSPDAFDSRRASDTIDSYYVFGVSITYGSPRNHVWTYASGFVEVDSGCPECVCPCINPSNPRNSPPPSFVGNNYYCESGNPGPGWLHDHLYDSDPLWDGKQCAREGQCCSDMYSRSAPWFSVALAEASSDDIEVRICSMEGSHDETPVQLLELYVK